MAALGILHMLVGRNPQPTTETARVYCIPPPRSNGDVPIYGPVVALRDYLLN
jgi:hypothetical protein